jgi:uncharacterized protein YlxW (UPF0749 family)
MFDMKFKKKCLVAVIGSLFVLSCAHKVNPVQYASTASPTDEVENMSTWIDQGIENQIDVLAPKSFQKSLSLFEKAKDQNENGKNPKQVFESLGYSRAYLNLAKTEASQASVYLQGVKEARRAAIVAGSRNMSEEMNDLDEEFMGLTKDVDSVQDIEPAEKTQLQSKYLNLELLSIKNKHLKDAKNILKST